MLPLRLIRLSIAGSLVCAACASPRGTALGLTPPATSPSAPTPADVPAESELAPAAQILARPDLAIYHGWIKFLRFQAEHAAARAGDAAQARARLADWSQRILAHPRLLSELRGVQEWAYESPVDGTGQPFKLNIPTNYDRARPAPVSLYMHGYSGNHLEHAVDMQDHPDYFEVSVLGRARGAHYLALSEADVLHVLDYVQANWSVDPDRVHIGGGSMGGHGTFFLGSRYPHRFASGRPVCGYAGDKPMGNLLSLPIYATHSDDDWTVPVLLSRGPLAQLKELGGTLVYDETTGYGHAVWDYKAGNERARAWAFAQKRPAAREIRRLDFTALDGVARRAWWAEIIEFGAEPEPARFMLRAEADNTLVAELRGVRRLGLRLAESPFDASRPLRISTQPAQGARAQLATSFTLPPTDQPLVVLDVDPATGQLSLSDKARAPAFRLRTPGGPNQLYAGEPLLIVYGTRGSAELRRAQETAARVAAESSRAEWWGPSDDRGTDGVSHNQNLYGSLPVKADTEVTADDIARRHLVLIGSASQNSIVARMAAGLPVSHADGNIGFSDGTSLSSEDRALGLVHYNPLAPDRLIFWVATDHAAAYAAGSLVPELMGSQLNAADLVVASVARPALVLARSFDSHWRWHAGRTDSPLLPRAGMTQLALGRAVARAVRTAAHTDFALAAPRAEPDAPAYAPGITRLSDLLTLSPYAPLSVMRLSGQELLDASRALERGGHVRFEPPLASASVSLGRSYSVALTPALVRVFVPATHLAPRDYRNTELTLADALRNGLSEP
jgi:dienelactone hydrolase